MGIRDTYYNVVDDFDQLPPWIKWIAAAILLQGFMVYNAGLYLLGDYYKGGWLVLVWLATVIFFGVYVNNFRLAKNRWLIGIALLGIPVELAVLTLMLKSTWQFYILDWFFAETFSFAIALALGGFIRGLKAFPLGLAPLAFGGLLAYAIAASFFGPLRKNYGTSPDLYWLLLIVPMLTSMFSKLHMFVYDINIGESVLIEKFEALFVTWILGWLFGWIIYAGACT